MLHLFLKKSELFKTRSEDRKDPSEVLSSSVDLRKSHADARIIHFICSVRQINSYRSVCNLVVFDIFDLKTKFYRLNLIRCIYLYF